MKQTPKYVKEVQELLAQLDNDGNNQDKQPLDTNTPEQETDVYIEDFDEEQRITLIRKKPYTMPVTGQEDEESELDGLDTAPLTAKPQPQPVSNVAKGVWLFGLLVPLFCIAVQLYFIANPFTVNVTLAAKTQHLSLTGTLQLGRVVNPITLSQSQTVPTTGRGHQDAKQATGELTFYNGQLTSVFIPAGTMLTGNSGEQIVTDADANIPAESGSIPPTLGQTTVPSHAVTPGSKGNIPLGDINQGCCATAIKVVNTSSFSGGQDARDFQTVTKTDVTNAATPLQATVTQGINATLQGQLKTNEALVTQSCPITTTADHQIGQEATQVKVTVSETCSAVAYDEYMLQTKVTDLMSRQATIKLGTGYSILESPQITINQAASQSSKVVLSFKAQSTWVYALTSTEQKHIKNMIAGKTKDNAFQLLLSLPGIEHVSIQSSGFGDDTRIPKYAANIHLAIIYV